MQNTQRPIKRLLALIFMFGLALTLVACGGSNNIPYGDLSDDEIYVTYGDFSISELELYKELRYQSADVLSILADRIVFKSEIEAVTALIQNGDEAFNTFIDETVNAELHGSSDLDDLNDLLDSNEERVLRNIEQYVDSMYLLDPSIDRDALNTQIANLNPAFENYASIPAVLDRYILRAAQRYYALEQLNVNINDEEASEYVDEQDVVRYYNNNVEGQYDVEAFIVRFINLNEANAALYATFLKSDARGNWYQIPDIRISDPQAPGYIDLNNVSAQGYPHVVALLEDLNLLTQLDDPNKDGVDYDLRDALSEDEIAAFYSAYTISTTRSNGLADIALPASNIKAKFVEIYNLLNPATPVQILADGSIASVGGNEFQTTFTYEELGDIDVSLRSHIYTTLTSETKQDEEDATNPYSSRVQTFGTSRYLVFKLDDESDTQEGILITDPEDELLEIFADTPEAQAAYEENREAYIDSLLTSSYVTSKVQARYDEFTLDIYDSVVRTFYSQRFTYEGTDSNKSGDVVARIADTDILVSELYEILEERFAMSVVLELLLNDFLLSNDNYFLTDEEYDEYETQFEEIIRQFSADQFASSGFPASIGREQFLTLAFGVSTNEEAIEQLYVIPELRDQFFKDYETQFGSDVYEAFTELAALQYNNFASINVSHLLVYFDQDGDGTPDDPNEYFDGLTASAVTEIKEGLAELVAYLYDQVGDFKSEAEAFTTLAELFNSSGRLDRGSNTAPYDLQIELEYAKYRRLGFYLKYETISSSITNSSNFVTNSSTLDPVFYDRAMALQALIMGEEGEDQIELPYLDFYNDYVFNGLNFMNVLDTVQSSFGWHFMLVTRMTEPVSAQYLASSDEDGRYENAEGLNVYNETSDALTVNQVRYYLEESKTDEGASLPTDVQNAINAFLQPVLTRYNNTYMQRELTFSLIADAIVFGNSETLSRFNELRDININQLNSYMLSEFGYYDENFASLYGTWFDILD